jgi:hypothetical protein
MVRCELIRFELHNKVCLQSTTNGHHGIEEGGKKVLRFGL